MGHGLAGALLKLEFGAGLNSDLYKLFEGSLEEHFRQHGQMKKQRWEESGKRSEEERRSEKEKSQKEAAGARKGRKVAAEPSGQMRDDKLRRCGAKRVSNSKCAKHLMLGALSD